MNRTFLIFLMIASALMIMVIGGGEREQHPEFMPWKIDIVDQDKIRVFGITLGKTRIQDANQILASFAKTRLFENEKGLRLVAIYDELNMGGLLAEIELEYDLSQEDLDAIKTEAEFNNETQSYSINKINEMKLLDTLVSKLTYRPTINYEEDIILQRFGTPDASESVAGNIRVLSYAKYGLDIVINTQGPDEFIYEVIKP